MKALIGYLSRHELTRPFVAAYVEGGGETTCLLAMCDAMEESDDSSLSGLARLVRAALIFTPC